MIESRAGGVPAGGKLVGSNAMFLNLDLPSARHQMDGTYSTKGQLIDCAYSLESHAIVDGCCMCGSDLPSVEIPMVLYSMYAPPPRYIQPPQEWAPVAYERVSLEYNAQYEAPNRI